MAAAAEPAVAVGVRPRVDFDYRMFNVRPDGKIACMGIGSRNCNPEDMPNETAGKLTCMAFTKVDDGNVTAVLPTTDFFPINWLDDPVRDQHGCNPVPQQLPRHNGQRFQYLRNEVQLINPNRGAVVPPRWQEFTNIMSLVNSAMLHRMTFPGDSHPPSSLFQGFQDDYWDGGQDYALSATLPGTIMEHITADVGAEQFTQLPLPVTEWVTCIINELETSGVEFIDLFRHLFPNCVKVDETPINNQQRLVLAVPETCSLEMGAIHCLVYSYHEDQVLTERQGRPMTRRVIQRTRCASDSRSRSRSPVERGGQQPPPLDEDVIDTTQPPPGAAQRPQRRTLMRNILTNPGRFIMDQAKLPYYLESHKPNALVYQRYPVPNAQNPQIGKYEVRVKIVIEIVSKTKCGSTLRLERVLVNNTERLVQSCIAAFGSNQDLMYGLLVLVDGLKLVKIDRQQNLNGTPAYDVSESDLISWGNPSMHELFHLINEVL